MSTPHIRQGSLEIVDQEKIISRGSLYVAQARLTAMMKWIWMILAIAVANPVLYLLSIGVGVGAFIDKSAGPAGIDGVKYLTFLAPALLATAAIQGAIDESVFPTLEGFNWWKNFLGMNATPISGNQIATGVFLASFVRVVGTVIIYWFVMLTFGALESSKAWLAIPTAVMAGVAFGSITQAIAGLLKDENMFFVIFNRFVMMPLFLFSGTFYPLSSMPIYLQWIGWISPLWHATELGRYLTYGHALTQTMAITHMVFLVALLVLGVFFSRRIFTKRLAQ
jgi:lipooligosaccharide transport system permease protein